MFYSYLISINNEMNNINIINNNNNNISINNCYYYYYLCCAIQKSMFSSMMRWTEWMKWTECNVQMNIIIFLIEIWYLIWLVLQLTNEPLFSILYPFKQLHNVVFHSNSIVILIQSFTLKNHYHFNCDCDSLSDSTSESLKYWMKSMKWVS